MRALVLWSEPASANLGVRALAEGTSALVRSAFPGAEVALQGYGPGDAPVRIGSARTHVKRLLRRSDELTQWVGGFDLVVDTRAGDSFADIYGIERLLTMSLMHEIALRARVPVVLGPQTIGPFESRRGQALARRTLRTAHATLVRDSRSLDVAERLGARRALPTTDVVFALPAPVPGPDRDVVLNVSGLLWDPNPHVDHVAYRRIVRELLEGLDRAGRQVTLLAHVIDSPVADNDVPVTTELGAEYGVDTVVPADLDDVRSVLAGATIAVGSRMHACLNALSVGTPAVPLAYSRKFAPLLAGIGWEHGVDLRDGAAAEDAAARVLATVEGDLAAQADATRDRAAAEIGRAVQTVADLVPQ